MMLTLVVGSIFLDEECGVSDSYNTLNDPELVEGEFSGFGCHRSATNNLASIRA